MRTLYLRNVPDDVVERLEALASAAGMSVSGFAVRELSLAARRAGNPALLAELPDVDVEVDDIVAALDHARANR